MLNKYNLNIKLIHALNLCRGLSYGWAVVYIIFLRAFALSFSQVSIIVAAFFLANFALEVQSGEFADLYGRKKSILIFGIAVIIINIIFIITSKLLDTFISSNY